jgi:hypothetical protein
LHSIHGQGANRIDTKLINVRLRLSGSRHELDRE